MWESVGSAMICRGVHLECQVCYWRQRSGVERVSAVAAKLTTSEAGLRASEQALGKQLRELSAGHGERVLAEIRRLNPLPFHVRTQRA
jgi:hypothetical protein